MSPRRSLCALFALLALGLAACGGADGPTQVATGATGDPGASEATTSTIAVPSTTAVPTSAPPTTATSAAPSASGDASGGTAASPVDGLTAGQLKAALAAPGPATGRSLRGPTVDQVALPDGRKVWRVTVPGDFRARSARVAVSVGSRRVGEAVLAPDLGSITAVTTDGSGLTAGKPVSYQWEGGPSIAAGTLAVTR